MHIVLYIFYCIYMKPDYNLKIIIISMHVERLTGQISLLCRVTYRFEKSEYTIWNDLLMCVIFCDDLCDQWKIFYG